MYITIDLLSVFCFCEFTIVFGVKLNIHSSPHCIEDYVVKNGTETPFSLAFIDLVIGDEYKYDKPAAN